MQNLYDAIVEHSELENGSILDAAKYGADGGFGGFIYYTDTDQFYEKNEGAIYELLQQEADMMGCKNIDEMVSQFNRSDMLDTPEGRRQLLSWFTLEEVGRWLETQLDSLRDDCPLIADDEILADWYEEQGEEKNANLLRNH
jgi:hypothetical protein